jgi:hypothetical protein
MPSEIASAARAGLPRRGGRPQKVVIVGAGMAGLAGG